MIAPALPVSETRATPMGMPKRPRDTNQLGKLIVDMATGATPAAPKPKAGSRKAKPLSSKRRAGNAHPAAHARRSR